MKLPTKKQLRDEWNRHPLFFSSVFFFLMPLSILVDILVIWG